MVFYARLQEKYHWRIEDVDETEMKLILRQCAAVQMVDAPQNDFSIEDIVL